MQPTAVTVRSLKIGQRFKLDPDHDYYYIRGPYVRGSATFECQEVGKHKNIYVWRYLLGTTSAYLMKEGEEA